MAIPQKMENASTNLEMEIVKRSNKLFLDVGFVTIIPDVCFWHMPLFQLSDDIDSTSPDESFIEQAIE